jgi:hypothetical protein
LALSGESDLSTRIAVGVKNVITDLPSHHTTLLDSIANRAWNCRVVALYGGDSVKM